MQNARAVIEHAVTLASPGHANPHAMGNECENGLPMVSRFGAFVVPISGDRW